MPNGSKPRTARSDGAELRVDTIRLIAALPERLGPKPGAAARAQFKTAFKGDGLIGGYRHCLAARLVLDWKEYPPASPSSSRWCSHEIAINGKRWQPTQRSEQAIRALVTSAARVAAADMKQADGRALRRIRGAGPATWPHLRTNQRAGGPGTETGCWGWYAWECSKKEKRRQCSCDKVARTIGPTELALAHGRISRPIDRSSTCAPWLGDCHAKYLTGSVIPRFIATKQTTTPSARRRQVRHAHRDVRVETPRRRHAPRDPAVLSITKSMKVRAARVCWRFGM